MPSNFFKTGLLLVIMTAIMVGMGAVVGGRSGLIIAFVVALGMNLVTYWKSDTLILRMHNAQEVDAQSAPELYRIVQELAERAALPMPRLFVMTSPQPNAFATGRSPESAALCASTGMLDLLNRNEVSGVMAHELAHIKNRDTLTMTIAASIGGAVSMFANMLQLGLLFGGNRNGRAGMAGTLATAVIASFAATLVQMAISRSREYQADQIGARICGNPLWLASALSKIQEAVRSGVSSPTAERLPSSAHMFIINPLTAGTLASMFSTHPSTENRVAELQKLAQEMASEVGQTNRGGIFLPSSVTRRPKPSADPSRGGPWG